MLRVDIHQHVWTRPLVDALAERSSVPRVVHVGDELILQSRGEAPYVIDLASETPARRLGLLEQDGLDLSLVAVSSPIGIEALPRDQATPLIEAHLAGVEALGRGFAVWGPIPLDDPSAEDVDRVLDRGCVGISLPAGALAHPSSLPALAPVLVRISERGVPLFVHPGPAPGQRQAEPATLPGPPWWTPMTGYVSQMQAAWLSFGALGRVAHPELTVVFSMLAGGGPLLTERLRARGGPPVDPREERTLYDTSSFGAVAIDAMAQLVGFDQLVYGSDRPVVEPVAHAHTRRLQENAGRLVPHAAHVAAAEHAR